MTRFARNLGVTLFVFVTPVAPAAPAHAAESARTLDEVTIEGEVRLPQVLFITSREAQRPFDHLLLLGVPTSAEIARGLPVPDRIPVLPPVTIPGGNEAGPTDSDDPTTIEEARETAEEE